MVFQSSKLKEAAAEIYTSDVAVYGKRGEITDRNNIVLAESFSVYRIDLDLKTIRNSVPNSKNLTKDQMDLALDEVARKLSQAIGSDYTEMDKKVKTLLKSGIPPASVNIARGLEKSIIDKVKALKIYGVLISSDTKRYYPNNNFLAQVLGFTGTDGAGIYGIESVYNKQLQGEPGQKTVEVDRLTGEDLPYTDATYINAENGKNVELSIDFGIQLYAEQAAEKALKDNKAKAVSIVVSDPYTGEVLAMVNKPDYNPNTPIEKGKTSDELNQLWRNRAVNDTFEPGSIFKVITAIAALKEGKTTPSDSFLCKGGLYVSGSYIRCDETHGSESFIDIIADSCNVGFMELGARLGREKLNNYIKLFGFGKKTGIDLNGESSGIIKATKDITNVDLACISFGQVDTVTITQYIAAMNAVANGGKWIRPHLMKNINHTDSNGNVVIDENYSNSDSKQIIDAETMKNIRSYLEQVVVRGTGINTYVPGLHIAGKTGTAQKAINGAYAAGKYVASFAGFAPADNPKYTVIVSIDEPYKSKYYASQTAAPVAKSIFLDLFNHEQNTNTSSNTTSN